MFIKLRNYIINYETFKSDILSINVSDISVKMITTRGSEITYNFSTKTEAIQFADELMTILTVAHAEKG